jgi:hypothetical protein
VCPLSLDLPPSRLFRPLPSISLPGFHRQTWPSL